MKPEIFQCARRMIGYKEEIRQALSQHYPDVVVGRPYRLYREETEMGLNVYSDQIENRWRARDISELKEVLERAKNDGIGFTLMYEPKSALDFLPKKGAPQPV